MYLACEEKTLILPWERALLMGKHDRLHSVDSWQLERRVNTSGPLMQVAKSIVYSWGFSLLHDRENLWRLQRNRCQLHPSVPPGSIWNSEWQRNEMFILFSQSKTLYLTLYQPSFLMNSLTSCCLSLCSSSFHHWLKESVSISKAHNCFTLTEVVNTGSGQY